MELWTGLETLPNGNGYNPASGDNPLKVALNARQRSILGPLLGAHKLISTKTAQFS